MHYHVCMKVCTKCLEEKDEHEFSWRNQSKGTRSSRCKTCHSLYSVIHYQDNAEKYKATSQRNRPGLRRRGRDFLLQYLSEHSCADCGISDIRVLQFDHVDPVLGPGKRVGHMIAMSLKRIQEEIEKCEVRCANCHMIRTADQFGWTRTAPVVE